MSQGKWKKEGNGKSDKVNVKQFPESTCRRERGRRMKRGGCERKRGIIMRGKPGVGGNVQRLITRSGAALEVI